MNKKIKSGKDISDKKYFDLAKNAIKKSGYDYLEGFFYYLLSDMQYSSAWDYVCKAISFLDEETISSVSAIKLDNYVKYLATIKCTSSSNQINSYSALKKLSKYLYANKMVEDDYMKYVGRPKKVETPEQIAKREESIITMEEFFEAIKKIREERCSDWIKSRNEAILKTFMGTGIRRAALYKMDINNIDLESGTIMVSEKGEKYRRVYCPQETLDSIKKWLEYRSEIIGSNSSEPAVFISTRKNRLCDIQIGNIIRKYTGKSPHKIRATYGTTLYDKSGDIYFVQKSLGHSSSATTQIYIRNKEEENSKKAAEIMCSVMK